MIAFHAAVTGTKTSADATLVIQEPMKEGRRPPAHLAKPPPTLNIDLIDAFYTFEA